MGVAETEPIADLQNVVPQLGRGRLQFRRSLVVDFVDRVAVHAHDIEHRLLVLGIALERSDHRRQFGAGVVGLAVHQRRDGTTISAAGVGVVRQCVGHQDAAEVRIAQSERTEIVAVSGDRFGRVRRVINQNFLGDQIQPASRPETLGFEAAARLDKFHQIDAGQIARGVVQEHVFAARIGRVDRTAVGARVPSVDRCVVLHARIATVPSTFGHRAEQFLGVVTRCVVVVFVRDPTGLPLAAGPDRLHVVVGQTHRQVRVLETNAAVGFAIEI